mgnify:CR=1 FL=1|mmetsp:Transcript_66863/g.149204  ORF Transcript_66863/g.149204 Transcript_66863/m.149204 type:complete len:155 (+) Transcript_66863:23-487(+)
MGKQRASPNVSFTHTSRPEVLLRQHEQRRRLNGTTRRRTVEEMIAAGERPPFCRHLFHHFCCRNLKTYVVLGVLLMVMQIVKKYCEQMLTEVAILEGRDPTVPPWSPEHIGIGVQSRGAPGAWEHQQLSKLNKLLSKARRNTDGVMDGDDGGSQ